VPRTLVHIRDREAADLSSCVDVLASVHRTSGYPTNWPDDPARWLTPAGTLRAWVATADGTPITGHVVVRQIPAAPAAGQDTAEVSRLFVAEGARHQGAAGALLRRAMQWAAARDLDLMLEVAGHLRDAIALYERTGFRHVTARLADWTGPGGRPVTLHQYRVAGRIPPASAVRS
jgi:GNAT superfamily N-acetyltransferase